MFFVAILILILILLVLCFIIASVKFGNKRYEQAKDLEQQGKFKDACYAYAVAILNGTFAKNKCRDRIKQLWTEHGPFDYADIADAMEDDPDGCENAGHAVTMSIIKEIVP